MVYPFLTLDDGTEIVHSEYHDDGTVKVYMETADEVLGFKHATIWLPSYQREDICGYPEDDIKRFEEIIRSTEHLIIRLSKEGGFTNASRTFQNRSL
jgi:hypothetical protein